MMRMSRISRATSGGTAAVVIVERGVQKAKEIQVIGQFPWLHLQARRLRCIARMCRVILQSLMCRQMPHFALHISLDVVL